MLQGIIEQLLPEVSGQGKSGNAWRKREFILKTSGQYPKQICISVWNDKIDSFPLSEGNDVSIEFDAESREYNGRWYTELKCYKMELKAPAPIPVQESSGHFDMGAEDDSPF